MNSAYDLQLDSSISGRFDLLGKLTSLAQSVYDALEPTRLVMTASLTQIMDREFIALQVADATHKVTLELSKLDLANPLRVQKRALRAWQAATRIRQSA